jgi:hypothetical protein
MTTALIVVGVFVLGVLCGLALAVGISHLFRDDPDYQHFDSWGC